MTRFVRWGDEILPVTHLFDIDRDEVRDLADAYTFAAGPMSNGEWLGGLVAEFPEIHHLKPH